VGQKKIPRWGRDAAAWAGPAEGLTGCVGSGVGETLQSRREGQHQASDEGDEELDDEGRAKRQSSAPERRAKRGKRERRRGNGPIPAALLF
jgi:Sec-independent protein translocase protein TatA